MDSAEILAALKHPVFIADAGHSLVFINENARLTLGLPPSGPLALDDVLQKITTKDGLRLSREVLDGPTPLRIYLATEGSHRVEAVLSSHHLSDHSICYELTPVQCDPINQIDPLTGLMDRGTMLRLIGEKRRNGKGALILIDIDRLKIINDFLGYETGDQVIYALAACRT